MKEAPSVLVFGSPLPLSQSDLTQLEYLARFLFADSRLVTESNINDHSFCWLATNIPTQQQKFLKERLSDKSSKPKPILILNSENKIAKSITAQIKAFHLPCLRSNPDSILVTLRSILTQQTHIHQLERELHQLKTKYSRLKKSYDHDQLSGLLTPLAFRHRLQDELMRTTRYGFPLAVIMLDLDHFKAINDDYDHLMGSYIISQVGRIIQGSIRKVDSAARFGGDEFIVLAPNTSELGASTLAKRIVGQIEASVFCYAGKTAKVTISAGVSIHRGEQKLKAEDLIRNADHSLYQAKRTGRGHISLSQETWH